MSSLYTYTCILIISLQSHKIACTDKTNLRTQSHLNYGYICFDVLALNVVDTRAPVRYYVAVKKVLVKIYTVLYTAEYEIL